MSKTTDITVTVRCRPFSGFPRDEYRCIVESDGNVLVWDSIAGHYTRCHSLSARDLGAIRREAAKNVSR